MFFVEQSHFSGGYLSFVYGEFQNHFSYLDVYLVPHLTWKQSVRFVLKKATRMRRVHKRITSYFESAFRMDQVCHLVGSHSSIIME